jgi:hypothetical protein
VFVLLLHSLFLLLTLLLCSYYNAVIIVDLFQFSNSYAPLPDIADVVQHGDEDDEGVTDLRSECENYVYTGARSSPRSPTLPLHESHFSLPQATPLPSPSPPS